MSTLPEPVSFRTYQALGNALDLNHSRQPFPSVSQELQKYVVHSSHGMAIAETSPAADAARAMH